MPCSFPLYTGVLSFREIPPLLTAFTRLQTEPDLVIVDGQGIAHPRRFGLASHLGLILDKPTIGCAKSRLWGRYEEPGQEQGAYTHLVDKGEVIGVAVRTRTNVSSGLRIYRTPDLLGFSTHIDLGMLSRLSLA